MTDNALDPVALARAVAIDAAENPDAVGDYVTQQAMEGGVTDLHVEHRLPSAVFVDSDLGPCGPSYHRLAVCERPSSDMTRRRDRAVVGHAVP